MKIKLKYIITALILGIIILAAFSATVGITNILSILSHANPMYLILAVAIFFTSYAFASLGTWHLLDKKAKKWFLLKIYVAGYFLNNITPIVGCGGELVKAEIISKHVKLRRTTVFAAILVQKILHYIPFIYTMFLSATVLALANPEGTVPYVIGGALVLASIAGVFISLFISKTPSHIHIVCRALESILGSFEKIELRIRPNKSFKNTTETIQKFHKQAHLIFWKRSVLVPQMYVLLSIVAEMTTLYFVIIALGQTIAVPALILAYTVAVTIGSVPITPGGLGTYDASLAGMLLMFSIPLEHAITAALLFRLIQYWMTNVLGIIALARVGK